MNVKRYRKKIYIYILIFTVHLCKYPRQFAADRYANIGKLKNRLYKRNFFFLLSSSSSTVRHWTYTIISIHNTKGKHPRVPVWLYGVYFFFSYSNSLFRFYFYHTNTKKTHIEKKKIYAASSYVYNIILNANIIIILYKFVY